MGNAAQNRLPPFLGAALIGSYGGIILQSAIMVLEEGYYPSWSEAWMVPLMIAVYGLGVLPFVSSGLFVFGLPAARLLHGQRQRWWMGIVAGLAGALAGKATFYAISELLLGGFYKPFDISLQDFGLLYGIPTGLAWWWLKRS